MYPLSLCYHIGPIALGITDNHIVTVADQTSPKSILIHIKFSFNME